MHSGQWFVWADWWVAGAGADIAGAVLLARSFVVKGADAIANEILLPLRTFDGMKKGFRDLAASYAQQRAEARMGAALLVAGFAAQVVGYLFTDGSSHFADDQERLMAVALVLAVWAVTVVWWRVYVPSATQRVLDAAYAAQEAHVDAARLAEASTQREPAADTA